MMAQLNAPNSPKSLGNSPSFFDRGTDNELRKRLHSDGRASLSPTSAGLLVPGTPSKLTCDITMNGMDDKEQLDEGAGLSRATVLILLAAHLIRMLYFHGLILEEDRARVLDSEMMRRPRQSAGGELDVIKFPDSTMQEENNMLHLLSLKPTHNAQMLQPPTSAIQWDLFGQSVSMIVVQLMLLHAMMRLRRRVHVRQKKKSAAYGSFADLNSPVLRNSQLNANHGANGAQQILDYLAPPRPFLSRQCERIIRGVKSHFLDLISPSSIMKNHNFLQYMELVFLSSMAIKLIFDYHWYPRYRMGIVEGLKHTSIVLESCLAMPQAMRNHGRGTTEGLSLVMVGGWVAGDFFKLCYFIIGMLSGNDEETTIEHGGNNVFVLGCLLALMMDLIVAMQMLFWYPTSDVLQLRERITQSVRHWKTNKDDDAGKSLLMKSPEYRKSGLFASAVHWFYAMFRRRPSNASQSLDS